MSEQHLKLTEDNKLLKKRSSSLCKQEQCSKKKLKQSMSQQWKDNDLLIQSEREQCSAAITIAKKKMNNEQTKLQRELTIAKKNEECTDSTTEGACHVANLGPRSRNVPTMRAGEWCRFKSRRPSIRNETSSHM
jgi:hypothetical protein